MIAIFGLKTFSFESCILESCLVLILAAFFLTANRKLTRFPTNYLVLKRTKENKLLRRVSLPLSLSLNTNRYSQNFRCCVGEYLQSLHCGKINKYIIYKRILASEIV